MKYFEKNKGSITTTSLKYPELDPVDAVFFQGQEDGKTLLVSTGVHGGEYVGPQAVREIIQELDPKKMKGNVLFLPLINRYGFYHGLKRIFPHDKKNLNNAFPGHEDGSYTERLAHNLADLYQGADFFIDLHGGDINESMTPLCFYPKNPSQGNEEIIAHVIGRLTTGYAVASQAKDGFYSYANLCGLPSLLLERGGGGRWSREEVDGVKKNIREVMDALEILPYEKTIHPPTRIQEAVYEVSPAHGFWYAYVRPGEFIREGQTLGRVETMGGHLVKNFKAKFDGVCLYHTHALGVHTDDALIAYGRP